MSKTVLITGATGMVGSLVLEELLSSPTVEKIVCIGRRKTGINDDKLYEIVHTNFLEFSNLSSELASIDVCFHCLGVYQNQVSKDEFVEITCDYQRALTDALQIASPGLTFVLFSASGADTNEKSLTLFARAKGKAENLLSETIFPKKYIFRPGYIHPTGTKRPAGFVYKLLLPVGAALFKLFPAIGISDRDLARAMVRVGLEGPIGSRVFSNQAIKESLS